MFLPDNAFAEKNELSGQQNFQKASVQANPPVKTDNAAVQPNVPAKAEIENSLIKTAEVPKPAQVEAKQQPAKISRPQAAPEKPVATSQNLPDQANGNGQSAIKKTEKTVNAPGTENAVAVQENKSRLEENRPTTKNAGLHTLQQTNTEVENRAQVSKSDKKFETDVESLRLSLSNKEDSFEPLVLESQKKGQVPSSKEEIPGVDQVLNPTQRSNSSGGQSNDRVSNGLNTSSLDKWFEWNKHYEVKFIRSYLSRHLLLNNQWVNAPPLLPPQEAPLKTVNRR